VPSEVQPPARTSLGSLRPMIGLGYTFGGDVLDELPLLAIFDRNVRAGEGALGLVGVEYHAWPQVSLQAAVGYHTESASNGVGRESTFSRTVVELLGHYHLAESWRLGGGARLVRRVELERRDDGQIDITKFDNTRGLVLEGEWRFSRYAGLKLRRVHETYRIQGAADNEADGSHWGVSMNVYFF
jgi:hypothetical protein